MGAIISLTYSNVKTLGIRTYLEIVVHYWNYYKSNQIWRTYLELWILQQRQTNQNMLDVQKTYWCVYKKTQGGKMQDNKNKEQKFK